MMRGTSALINGFRARMLFAVIYLVAVSQLPVYAYARPSIEVSSQPSFESATQTLVQRSTKPTSTPRCECGYTVNSTNSSDSYALYTDLLETDFLHLYSLPDSIAVPASKAVGWAPQVYNMTADVARGPYGKTAELNNVVLNPLSKPGNWSGEGKLGGAPGLQLWVRGQNEVVNDMVRGSEVDSLRNDMLYGSFRIGMRMSDIPGTCASFFWYRNNTQEIDMEYLTREANSSNGSYPINLVVQSPEAEAAGYDAAGTYGFRTYSLPFAPGSGYHEYRFDWTPERITFFADGALIADFENGFNSSVPDGPGTIMLNHWSNGNTGWSGGPPAVDTALTISYVKAYFNSSNTTRQSQWSSDCADKWQNRTCEIPGFPNKGINPLNGSVEDAGKSFFFTGDEPNSNVNQTLYPAANSTSSGAEVVLNAPGVWQVFGWVLLGMGVYMF